MFDRLPRTALELRQQIVAAKRCARDAVKVRSDEDRALQLRCLARTGMPRDQVAALADYLATGEMPPDDAVQDLIVDGFPHLEDWLEDWAA